jgi:exosortase A-associated hydrolase 2
MTVSSATIMSRAEKRMSTAMPRFVEFNGRRLFSLHIRPTGLAIGAILYLPPFAEEMNRCRSHVAAQARALAAAGYHCLLLDPFGTGESEGEILDASWSIWIDDARAAAQWLASETGLPVSLWGIRTGALLAAEVASTGPDQFERLLFWQPVHDGKLFLNQYLRLRIAAQMFNETEKETTDQLRARLQAGEAIEIAGYPLSGTMANDLASRSMAALDGLSNTPIAWLEVTAKPGQSLPLPSRKLIDGLIASGGQIETCTPACPMIWQVHERVAAPELIACTLELMAQREIAA